MHFDGATELESTNITAVNSSLFSFAMWIKLGAGFLDGGYNMFVLSQPLTVGSMFYTYGNADGSGRFSAGADADGNFLFFNFAAGSLVENAWAILMGSSSTNFAVGNKIVQLYKGDTPLSGSVVDTSPAFQSPSSGADFSIPDSVAAAYSGILDVANPWFAPGQFIDFSVLGNRRKFVDGSGKPVDLGTDGSIPTGTAPAIFFSGNASSFAINKGTGGAFTLTGALTNASSSPSD